MPTTNKETDANKQLISKRKRKIKSRDRYKQNGSDTYIKTANEWFTKTNDREQPVKSINNIPPNRNNYIQKQIHTQQMKYTKPARKKGNHKLCVEKRDVTRTYTSKRANDTNTYNKHHTGNGS